MSSTPFGRGRIYQGSARHACIGARVYQSPDTLRGAAGGPPGAPDATGLKQDAAVLVGGLASLPRGRTGPFQPQGGQSPSVEAYPGPLRSVHVLEDILPNRLDLRRPHVLGYGS